MPFFMKNITTILFTFSFHFLAAQINLDTLHFGDHKYAMPKSKSYFNHYQNGEVLLPSEYQLTLAETTINYNYSKVSSTIQTQDDNPGVMMTDLSTGIKAEQGKKIIFSNIIDTILLKDASSSITPFIQSKKNKYVFCNATVYGIQNDTLKEFGYISENEGIKLDASAWEVNKTKTKTIFFVTGLYYRKKDATYYLNWTVAFEVK